MKAFDAAMAVDETITDLQTVANLCDDETQIEIVVAAANRLGPVLKFLREIANLE